MDFLHLYLVSIGINMDKIVSLSVFSRPPEILWAQRSDKIYLTVALPDAKDILVKCEPEGLFKFSASGPQGEKYECMLELFGAILPEVCFLFISSSAVLSALGAVSEATAQYNVTSARILSLVIMYTLIFMMLHALNAFLYQGSK